MTNEVLLAFAAGYAVTFVVLTAWLRTIPTELQRYCYPILAVLGLGVPVYGLTGLGLGVLTVGGTELTLFTSLHTVPMGIVVWVTPVLLAGLSRKYVALVVAAVSTITPSFLIASLIGGIVMPVGLAVVLLAHAILFWIILGPGWRAVKQGSARRRLVYWKLRNLLVFLFGLNLPVAFMSLAFTEFVGTVLREYMLFLMAAGFAAFLFANIQVFKNVDFDLTTEMPAQVQ